jgi:putative oxidoreductase
MGVEYARKRGPRPNADPAFLIASRRRFAAARHRTAMSSLDRQRDLGLLLLRVGIGAMFVFHGWPKMIGGPAKWESLGHATEALGIAFAPTFWGFMAAFAEVGGGLMLALGVAFRPACALLLSTMIVASARHLTQGDGFGKASHAIEAAILFMSLLLIGPGAYRLRGLGK